jgi:hypothetical protein
VDNRRLHNNDRSVRHLFCRAKWKPFSVARMTFGAFVPARDREENNATAATTSIQCTSRFEQEKKTQTTERHDGNKQWQKLCVPCVSPSILYLLVAERIAAKVVELTHRLILLLEQ